MLEDEDSKVRRNLVVFGALILAFTWLEIPSALILERLLGTTASGIESWKLWGLNLCVLLYLSMRYYSSEEHQKAVQSIHRAMDIERKQIRRSIVQRHVDKVLAARDDARSDLFGHTLLPVLGITKKTSDAEAREVCAFVQETTIGDQPGWRTAELNVTVSDNDMGLPVRIGFCLGPWRDAYVNSLATFRALWNTYGGTTVLSAWGIALGAVSIAGWRLGSALNSA